jgi:hypothetical protein
MTRETSEDRLILIKNCNKKKELQYNYNVQRVGIFKKTRMKVSDDG